MIPDRLRPGLGILLVLLGPLGCGVHTQTRPRAESGVNWPKMPTLDPANEREVALLWEEVIIVADTLFQGRGPWLRSMELPLFLKGEVEIGQGQVFVEIGLDSSREKGAPKESCLDGLLDVTPGLSPTLAPCADGRYPGLYRCPEVEPNRLPLFVVRLRVTDLASGTQADLPLPSAGQPGPGPRLGTLCTLQSSNLRFRLPEIFMRDGRFDVKVTATLVADVKRRRCSGCYRGYLKGRAVSE